MDNTTLKFAVANARAEYYKAKEDNRALHKGIKRLKNKEKELLDTISSQALYIKCLESTPISNCYTLGHFVNREDSVAAGFLVWNGKSVYDKQGITLTFSEAPVHCDPTPDHVQKANRAGMSHLPVRDSIECKMNLHRVGGTD